MYDEAGFLAYTAWMHAQFAARGTPLLATYWCPHHPEEGLGDYRVACECRKPRPGMLLSAIARFGIDAAQSRHAVWQQITQALVRRGWLAIMVAAGGGPR